MSLRGPIGPSLGRIGAIGLRHWYLLRGSWPRVLDLAYWPAVQILLWGYIQTFLAGQSGLFAQTFGLLIAATWLWDVLLRSQLGYALSFFEEVWSRNLGHLLVSPMRPSEFLLSLMLVSFVRALIGLIPASFLAMWVFDFSIYSLGLGLVAFFFNLMVFGWAIGFVITGLVLRYGQGAESLAWALIFAVAPIAGVYYPVSVLPGILEALAYCLPAAYVFEGMRAVMIEGTVRVDLMLAASALNLVWLTGGAVVFYRFLGAAQRRGTLLQIGE
jgi:ABC-2 type transport system permease protein